MSQAMMVRHAAEADRLPNYTYTGESQLMDDGKGNWRIKFLTSGEFRTNWSETIDVFLVGGGGGGGCSKVLGYAGGGGGGGKTLTLSDIDISNEVRYYITVGAGGRGAIVGGNPVSGGDSIAFGGRASGGSGASWSGPGGGSGGSGGSAGGASGLNEAGNNGGSDGSNGVRGPNTPGGNSDFGQGTTTREFGEPSGDLYGGGGGGGTSDGESAASGTGGAGGGGDGGKPGARIAAQAGKPNTGGGGGGGSSATPDGDEIAMAGGYGGTGIVVIRNAR